MNKWKWILPTIALLFPFAWLILLSFGQQWAFPDVLPSAWTSERWTSLVHGEQGLVNSLVLSLLVSCTMATLVTLCTFFLCSTLAYHRYRRWIITLSYLPYVFAPVVYAACLQIFFLRMGGSGQWWGVMVAQWIITFPYGILFFMGFWNDTMKAYLQLSSTLGASKSYSFRKILLPIAKEPLLVCFFQVFLISWFEYGLTTLIGVGKVQTLTVKVFQFITEANLFYASMASVLLFLPPLVLLWINKKYVFNNSMHADR